jgi:ribosomal protein L11 methyltransferase
MKEDARKKGRRNADKKISDINHKAVERQPLFLHMHYLQLTIVANDYQQEELIALLNDFNPTGYEQHDEVLIAYFEQEGFNEATIHPLLDGFDYRLTEVEEQNWNKLWESNFQPVVVGDFCAVRAHFHQPITNVAHEIIITPKMSFGTGHHATTYMMMEQMRDIDFRDKEVFDFGTGTGILAILAEKLGARRVMAIDVDEWSIENARENIERNGCTKIDVTLSTTIPEQEFDVILANINRNVLLQYAEQLKNACKKEGILLLSGLMIEDATEINEAFTQQDFGLIKQIERNNWISLLFAKGS